MHDDNDGRFPDNSPVEIRYPRSKAEEHGNRSAWPWLPGTILEQQCGPDEWYVYVEVRELAVLADGRRRPRGWHAHAFPLSVDGIEIVASLVLLADRRAGQRSGWLPWAR